MNLFEAIFTHDSSSPAIHFGRRRITYGELREETSKMAQLDQSLGVRRGDRIALLLHDSPEFVEAFIAICSLGAIAVPINMSLREEEQAAIIKNSGASFAFVEDDAISVTQEQLRTITLHDLKTLLNDVVA